MQPRDFHCGELEYNLQALDMHKLLVPSMFADATNHESYYID